MNRRIQRHIEKIYKVLYKRLNKVFDPNLKYREKENFVKNYSSSKEFYKFKNAQSRILSTIALSVDKNMWKDKYTLLKKSKKLSITYRDYELKIKKDEQEAYLQFLSELPKKILEANKYKYIKALQKKVLTGEIGRKSFENLLKSIGLKNAKTIARTETSRLQAKTVESRSRKLSSQAYKWVSTHDVRTRESHKNMKNVVVFWDDTLENKPHLDNMYGNAGEFPNCRCFAFPIFKERDLPPGGLIKVWSAEKGKIIKMTRGKLIEKI